MGPCCPLRTLMEKAQKLESMRRSPRQGTAQAREIKARDKTQAWENLGVEREQGPAGLAHRPEGHKPASSGTLRSPGAGSCVAGPSCPRPSQGLGGRTGELPWGARAAF